MTVFRHLVTGGAGFIGSHLVAALLKQGDGVRVLDNLSTGHWDNLAACRGDSLELIEGDIRDAQQVERAAAGVELIFHQAANVSVEHGVKDPVLMNEQNVGGTVQVLDVARHIGVKRVIFASSCAIYGETDRLPIHEDLRPNPLSAYGTSKLAGEGYARAFYRAYGLESLCLRYFNVFGPRQPADGAYAAVIPRFAQAALNGEEITIYGDGEQTRDFCYVDNVVQANLLAARCARVLAGEAVNVGSGHAKSIKEVAAAIASCVGEGLASQHAPARSGEMRHSWADISRAERWLAYRPQVSWAEGLERTLADFR